MAFAITELARAARSLTANANFYIGTSSWKYEGWIGQIYDEQRYLTRGRFSQKRFDTKCLGEYAETFPAVCVDAAYYRFPTERYLAGLDMCVPKGFRFSFKVTDEITVKKFPRLGRFGERAGSNNPNFLNARLFIDAFLGPLARHRNKTGVLIFEFSSFNPSHFTRGRDFVAALDRFLGQLPSEWQYAVEIRNPSLLHPDYFRMLSGHGVAHLFNSWTKMPPVEQQMQIPDAFTSDFFAARFLLCPGRAYQQAVDKFSPYREVREPYPQARATLRQLIARAQSAPTKRPSFAFVNNRLEGNSPATIAAVLNVEHGRIGTNIPTKNSSLAMPTPNKMHQQPQSGQK